MAPFWAELPLKTSFLFEVTGLLAPAVGSTTAELSPLVLELSPAVVEFSPTIAEFSLLELELLYLEPLGILYGFEDEDVEGFCFLITPLIGSILDVISLGFGKFCNFGTFVVLMSCFIGTGSVI